MISTGLIIFLIGSFCAFLVWFFLVRPYVVKHGKGYRTGATMGIVIWVDWQSCGEIADQRSDSKGQRLYRLFGFFQIVAVVGFLMQFF